MVRQMLRNPAYCGDVVWMVRSNGPRDGDVEVKSDAHPALIERSVWDRVQARLARTVWAKTDRSWYKRADGRITNNWSSTTAAYWWKTRRVDLASYVQKARARVAAPLVAKVA